MKRCRVELSAERSNGTVANDVTAGNSEQHLSVDDDNDHTIDCSEQKMDDGTSADATVLVKQKEKQHDLKPITRDGDMPQKKFYRSRAHCNPLSHNDAFDYPSNPLDFDWTKVHYPNHPELHSLKSDVVNCDKAVINSTRRIAPTVLDIGCGFGGLTVALAKLLSNETVLGLEIRAKVTEYVRLRIVALRKEYPNVYENCSVMRSNAMKFMPNFFERHSLNKIFFCFPDPHFKRKNHVRRIISDRLLTEYAYFLKPGYGRLYCITDVEDLHEWHMAKCRDHPLFRDITNECCEKGDKEDPCVEAMKMETEEGKKVERSGVKKYFGVFQRINEEEETKLVESTKLFA